MIEVISCFGTEQSRCVLPITWTWKQIQYPKRCAFKLVTFRTMDKVQEPCDSEGVTMQCDNLKPMHYKFKKIYCGPLKNKELCKYEELAITSLLAMSLACLPVGQVATCQSANYGFWNMAITCTHSSSFPVSSHVDRQVDKIRSSRHL
jgi:hypothetical protein